MAEGQLCVEIDFRHGALEFGKKKERVIAETARAARRVQNDTFHGSITGVLDAAVAGSNQDAVVAGLSLLQRLISETLKKDHVVPYICIVIGVRRVNEACIRGEASRTNSRRTLESIDFEAGVVGQNQLTGRKLRVVDSLDGGVRGKGIAIFFRSFDVRQAGERLKTDGVSFSGSTEIAQLSLA